MKFLGNAVDGEGIHTSDDKTAAVQQKKKKLHVSMCQKCKLFPRAGRIL